MNTDCIINIFNVSDSYTKLAISLVNSKIYTQSKQYIQPIKIAIEQGDIFSILNTRNWYDNIDSYNLGKIGSELLINIYSKYHTIIPNQILYGACRDGHIEIVNFIIQRRANDWSYGLCEACRGGNIEIINLMIQCGANNWNWGLSGACRGGHLEIINLMIQHGANSWNTGLYGACRGGHLEIVNLMIQHGANNWDSSLQSAVSGNHSKIIKLIRSFINP